MWFSGFSFLILSLIVEVYLWWKWQASLIFLSGRTCTIGGWLNTFLPHCIYYMRYYNDFWRIMLHWWLKIQLCYHSNKLHLKYKIKWTNLTYFPTPSSVSSTGKIRSRGLAAPAARDGQTGPASCGSLRRMRPRLIRQGDRPQHDANLK